MNLVQDFQKLQRPRSAANVAFSAQPITHWPRYHVACDALGRPALLVDPLGERRARPNAELKYVSLWPAAECEIASKGSTTTGVFSIVWCKSDEQDLQELFLEVLANWIEALGPEPTRDALSRAFERLAQLFEALVRPSTTELRGLWGELLVLTASSDPMKLVSAWHANPSELYDFEFGLELAEVKTTSARPRRHDVSLAQLTPPAGSSLVLVSVLAEVSEPSLSIKELIGTAKSRLNDPGLRLRVDEIVAATLGTDWCQAQDAAFNARRAVSELRFVASDRVPCVNRDLPPEVSDVRFKVELDGIESLKYNELRSKQGLHAAMVPDERIFHAEARRR